jgi:Uncharacterised nucleotidyltransferase
MERAKSASVSPLTCDQFDASASDALTDMSNDDILKHVLLDLISSARPVAASRLDTLSDADWDSLCRIAKQHRIAPMIHHRIQVLKLSSAVPPHVRDQWAGAYRKAAFRYLSFRKTLAILNEILEKAQIPFAALKGAWLSQYAYFNPVCRPLRDIDILVEPDAALWVYALLEKNGFVRHEDFSMPLDGAFDKEKHLPPMWCTETGILIEVHTRLMELPTGPLVQGTLDDVTLLLGRREYRAAVPYLSPTDTLLHLIVHAAYDHQFNNGPLTFNDIASVLESAPIDWPTFWAMAKAGNWLRGCIIILELASYYHGAKAWRASYDGSILAPSDNQLESAALLSLQNFDHRGVITLKAEIADNKAWFVKARSLFNRIFPPLHRLAAFSGASTSSYWSLLQYPCWLFAGMNRVVFAKDDAAITRDVDRAKDVRNWMYDDSPVFSAVNPRTTGTLDSVSNPGSVQGVRPNGTNADAALTAVHTMLGS